MSDAEEIWAKKSDEELLEAAGDLDEFTEEGERIIRAELRRRKLPAPDAPIGRCANCGRAIRSARRRDACAQCGTPYPSDIVHARGGGDPDVALVCVVRTSDAGLMGFAKSLLESEGIDSRVRGDQGARPLRCGSVRWYQLRHRSGRAMDSGRR